MYREVQYDPLLIEKICRSLQQFMPLSIPDIQELMQYCELRQFDKKEVIVGEGDTDNYLSMVVRGLVMKYIRLKRGDVILQLATEGHVIASELSYLVRVPSTVIIETLEPTLLVSIRNDRMEDALRNYPKGEELGRKILENMYIRKDERRFIWQSMELRERFLYYIRHHPHMLQRVPQKYLASYLNIKPETFSRLKHLTRKSDPEVQ
jgi:CRP-like cAMP-binding protein